MRVYEENVAEVVDWCDLGYSGGGGSMLGAGRAQAGLSTSWLGPLNSAVLLTHCSQLILRKISKFDASIFLKLKCTEFHFRWGSARDPAGRAYSAPQTP